MKEKKYIKNIYCSKVTLLQTLNMAQETPLNPVLPPITHRGIHDKLVKSYFQHTLISLALQIPSSDSFLVSIKLKE